MRRFDSSAPWPQAQEIPPGAELRQDTPARSAGFVSDVLVPLAQAGITGLAIGAVLAVAIAALTQDTDHALALWLLLSLALATIAWVLLLFDTRRLLWAVERLTGLDIDRDGAKGEPRKRTLEVAVQTGSGSEVYVDADWLEIDDDQFVAFAQGIVSGRKLTEAAWARDRNVFPEGINQFRAFRDRIEAAGLIRRVNPDAQNSTYEPTPLGMTVFRRLVEYAQKGR